MRYIKAILIVLLLTLRGETMGVNNKQIKSLIKDVCVQMRQVCKKRSVGHRICYRACGKQVRIYRTNW